MSENQQPNGYRDPDSFDFQGALQGALVAVRQHKLLVFASCVFTLALTVAYVYLFPPVYVASAKAMAEKPADTSRDNFYTMWNVFRKDDPRTEIELMLAPGMIAKVVEKEGLKYDDVYHPFLSHLNYLWRGSLPGQTYHRVKDYFFPPRRDPEAPSAADIELARTVTDMRSGISMVPIPDSDVGELTMKGPSRRVAKAANTLLEIYLAERTERYRMEAQRNLDALDQEVTLAAREAQDIADKRLAFMQSNGLAFDLTKESQQLTKLVDLEDGIASNKAKVAALDASLQAVESQLNREPLTRTLSTTQEANAVRESTRLKRLDLQTQLISLRAVYQEDSREVQEVVQNIAAIDALIAAEPEKTEKGTTVSLNSLRQDLTLSADSLRSQLAGAKAGMTVMEETDRKLRARMAAVPELQNTVRDFDRKYALVSERFQALSVKRAQAAVSRAMAGSATPSLRVFQWASSPDEPSWPKLKILYPSALLVGFVVGVIAAQLRTITSGRVRRHQLSSGRPGAGIYGTIRIPIGSQPFSVAGIRQAPGSKGNES